MMTNWLPDLTTHTGPLYARLADAIENAIDGGTLPAGAKLPPQRNLAFDIGVTIGTVSRAYAIMRERGLVSGEVGRGTYVLAQEATCHTAPHTKHGVSGANFGGTRTHAPDDGMLRFDSTAAPLNFARDAISEVATEILSAKPAEIYDYSRSQPEHWRQAGASWLASGGWKPNPKTVLQTNGAHSGLMAVIAATTMPGDSIVFEDLTYSSLARSAAMMGRRTVTVETHADGIDPDELERVCAQRHPKLLFLMPACQNPTMGIMSEEKRRAVAEIAMRYNILVIEDSVYAPRDGSNLVLLAELIPERVFHVGSLSKSVSAGLRCGWISCPPHYANRVQIALKMLSGGIAFLMAETSARLVNSGVAEKIREQNTAEIRRRVLDARAIFNGVDIDSREDVPFLWMRLPEPWLSGTYKAAAAAESILIDDEDEFKVGRSDKTWHRVRIGVSAPEHAFDAHNGLVRLRQLLDSGAGGYDTFN
jgi:DNA-binding transcriptional MocR family regulator